MNYPTCKTCKHWAAFQMNPKRGECLAPQGKDKGQFLVHASAACDFGLYSQLQTSRDFGCSNHQPHELPNL